ncbi:1-propanol dehydrogenase PduQ [uncultured Pseudoflavonifractor sp.]|uniref:1-propanol dehydrogenase PduQ n=1 Tax=uncultured Pseudoflavonifractor sp. TaxID=1221379 RepID=UPI0025E54743|nr:1-propanol dehydrogenase PduQ [uncultured Pseudoflavonifractor sp.]
MREFSFSTRIFFGEGALERLARVKNKRVMMVTDHYMAQSGTAERVASHLTDCQLTIFSGVTPDPSIHVVSEGVKVLLDCKAEVMIALGGGSAIDAAKAIRAVASKMEGNEIQIEECFAIPTTSGTGSEVTEAAVITDTDQGVKYPLVSQELRPPIAILDPELVLSAPPSVTADTGMDVLTHALEAHVANAASDFTDALAEKSIALTFRFLPIATLDGSDLHARERMHNASCMAGLAFNSAGLGVCHSIAHAVGGQLHISHGRLNAMLLPHVLAFNADLQNPAGFTLAAKKYQHIAKLLYLPAPTVRLGVTNLITEVERLMQTINIPANLRECGADMDKFKSVRSDIVRAALNDRFVTDNPRPVRERDVEFLLSKLAGD